MAIYRYTEVSRPGHERPADLLAAVLGQAFTCLLPWPRRKLVLTASLGYEFVPVAHIAVLSWAFPDSLDVGLNSKVAQFNVMSQLHALSA